MAWLPQIIPLSFLGILLSWNSLISLLITVESFLILILAYSSLFMVSMGLFPLFFLTIISVGVGASVVALSILLKMAHSSGNDMLPLNPSWV